MVEHVHVAQALAHGHLQGVRGERGVWGGRVRVAQLLAHGDLAGGRGQGGERRVGGGYLTVRGGTWQVR